MTGVAVALKEGEAIVTYSDTVRYKSKVVVYKTIDIVKADEHD